MIDDPKLLATIEEIRDREFPPLSEENITRRSDSRLTIQNLADFNKRNETKIRKQSAKNLNQQENGVVDTCTIC